ncbi:MAG: polysaccharide biosynthesis protein [Lachnospiraceae bacterium]|nr:polysaccharide biosynthesis protein [Candidatus Colinaster scatohippi]
MGNKEHKKSNFIFQAGILAMAGIIVRIIGILYRSPLVMIIGDEGNGYYNSAYVIYTIILLISSYSIPSAISKVIAARLGLGQYRNAHKLFKGSLMYVTVVGGIGSAVCFFFADRMVGTNSSQVLQIFAPTIFLSGFLGTLRGYFQAHRTMKYTSYSQIIEQIINAVVSITAAYIFVRLLAGMDDTAIAIGGAKGSAIGTGAGVLTGLIFMLIIYLRKRPEIMKDVAGDKSGSELSYAAIGRIIFGMVTPVVLSTCIYNLSSASNLKIYQYIVENQHGYTEAMATTNYGLFSGKAMQIVNIPIAIASAMAAAIIPTIARTHERGEYKEGREKIAYAVKVTMLIAMPSAFGLLALAEPVTLLLYPQRATYMIVAKLIRALSVTVIFYCLSTLSNAILQGTGNVNIPVVNAAVSLFVQAGVLVILLKNTSLDLYALVIVTIIYSALMCILNGVAMRVRLRYKQEVIRSYFLPFQAALGMYLVAVGTNWTVSHFIRISCGNPDMIITGWYNILRLVVSMLFAVISYAWFVLHMGVAREKEILMMPKGAVIVRVLKRLGLIHEHDIVNRRRQKRGQDILVTSYSVDDEVKSISELKKDAENNKKNN